MIAALLGTPGWDGRFHFTRWTRNTAKFLVGVVHAISATKTESSVPRSTSEVFDSHLNLRIDGDLERDLVENYSEKVVLLTVNSNMSGHDAIRASAARLREQPPGAKFEFVAKQVNGPHALMIWRATSQRFDDVKGADSFVIKAGKIVSQSIHYRLVAG